MTRLVLSSILFVMGAGCAPYIDTDVQIALASPAPLPEETLTPVDIPIYRSSLPARPYREIGVAFVRTGSDIVDIGARWREAAATIGGDALIDMQVISGGYVATVIAWTDEEGVP